MVKASANKVSLIHNLLLFYQKASKLKDTTRHSWLRSSERQESVADHTWMLTLLAIAVFDELDMEVDQLRVLKMLIIHDLAEAATGDIPAHEVSTRQDGKHEAEQAAFVYMLSDLPETIR